MGTTDQDVARHYTHVQRMTARAAQGGPPPLGLHIMMVRDAPTKVANMIANLERGLIAPVELIARRR